MPEQFQSPSAERRTPSEYGDLLPFHRLATIGSVEEGQARTAAVEAAVSTSESAVEGVSSIENISRAGRNVISFRLAELAITPPDSKAA